MEFELLNNLKNISAKLGNNPMLIQCSGGNSSLKIEEQMFIKASGMWLADANKKNIFVNVAWKQIKKNINFQNIDPLEGATIGNSSLRPSIETSLHALMPHKVVFHTHPIDLLSILVQIDARNILNDVLRDYNWSWVDYACPGIDLTQKVKLVLRDNNSDILILGNHGLVVGSNSCEGVVSLTEELATRLQQTKRSFKTADDTKIRNYAKKLNMRPVKNNVIHTLAIDYASNKFCNFGSTVLYPDQAVFLGRKLNCIEPDQIFVQDTFNETNGYVIVNKIGVFVANNSKPEIEDMLKCHSELLLRVPGNKNLRYLSTENIRSLVNWDAEIYRQNIKR